MGKIPSKRARAGVWGWILGIAIGSAIDNVGAGIAIGIGPGWVLGLVFSQAIQNAP